MVFGKKTQATRDARLAALAAVPPQPDLVKVREAAAFLGISEKALYARVQRGQLACLRMGTGKRARIRFTWAMLVDSLSHESSTITTERAA
jgi:hypothetical protein